MRLKPVAAIIAVLSVIAVPVASASPDEIAAALNDRPLNGAGNNVAHPDWGRADRTYLRVAPAVYGDGIGSMAAAPPARYVSNRIFNDVAQNVFSENGVTQWGFVWGQFLDHTFGLRQETGGEYRPIPFDRTDPLESYVNDFGAIDFARTPAAPGTGVAGSPREQINTVSSYIDASSVYSDDDARLAWLRDGARLKLDADGNLPRRGSDPTRPGDGAAGPADGPGREGDGRRRRARQREPRADRHPHAVRARAQPDRRRTPRDAPGGAAASRSPAASSAPSSSTSPTPSSSLRSASA